MPRQKSLWYRVSDHRLMPASGKGSALLLCLVLVSALSALAVSSLEAAWTGQRMISAYASHQQTFLQLERALLVAEDKVWQQINTTGLGQFLSTSQNTSQNTGPAQTLSIIRPSGDWIKTSFSQQQCGPLFELIVLPDDDSGSAAGLRVSWDVCCANTESCMVAEFTRQRRSWSRFTG